MPEAPEGSGASFYSVLYPFMLRFSMQWRDSLWTVPGDEAWRRRERARKRREYTLQAVLILLLISVLATLSFNVADNLEAKHIRSGFDFLFDRAGFDIGEKAITFTSSDQLWRAFLVGLLNTLHVAVLSIITATVLGVVVGIMRISKHPAVRFLGAAHVEAYRNVPLLVLLLAIYLVVTELLPNAREAWSWGGWIYLSKSGLLYAVPAEASYAFAGWLSVGTLVAYGVWRWMLRRQPALIAGSAALLAFVVAGFLGWFVVGVFWGWNQPVATRFSMRGGAALTPEFLSLWLGLTLFTSAAIAEIVRAGVVAVRPSQWDAGFALGFTRLETVSYVVFPQSMRLAIPPLASQYMNLTKNSSLAVMVGYPDLVNVANTTINVSAQALEVICIIMGVYLTINLVIALGMNGINSLIMRAPQ